MLFLFQGLVLNIFYLCYFTPSVNHNLSLFSQTGMMVLVTPQLPANSFTLVSKLIQLKMTFSSDHFKHPFKSFAHQVLLPFFFSLRLHYLTRFLFSWQRPFAAASSHLSLSSWRPTLTRHSKSFQANISIQCLILAILLTNPL